MDSRNITNQRLADYTDDVAEKEQKPEAIIESLDKTYMVYKVKMNVQKPNLMTNSVNVIKRVSRVMGQTL